MIFASRKRKPSIVGISLHQRSEQSGRFAIKKVAFRISYDFRKAM